MSILKGAIKSGAKIAINIKDDVIASTKLNSVHEVINNVQNNEPYTVTVKQDVDLTSQNPYCIGIKIKFNDLVFKKRISNIIKDNRYELKWTYTETNMGSTFKPKYVRGINMYLEQGVPPLTQLVLGVASFGFIDFADSADNIPLSDLYSMKFHFKNKENGELFADKLENVIALFLEKQLGVYETLKSNT